jgi:SAM-dependent methyltransferase
VGTTDRDSVFGDEVARLYEQHLVPLIFEPYADVSARRLAALKPARVLEIACGTGVLTRALARELTASITATDLNPAMLARAQRAGTSRPVTFRQADALALPFRDASFDAVVCQFGVMFFPDKSRAFAEARRVLSSGGVFLFSVWDRIEENEVTELVVNAVAEVFPEDPPRFMQRTPHGYFDRLTIEQDLARGGFPPPVAFEAITARSRASSAGQVAIGICQGTPLRNEIEMRDPSCLAKATEAATRALVTRFGTGPLDGRMQAYLIVVRR